MTHDEEVEEIRTRMKSAFANIYLTLLSIIQGVTLAVLFSKVDSLISRQMFHVPQVLMSIGVFFVIVAVWNQYQMGVMLYAWTALIFDALIPFTLGAVEFWMIGSLDRGASAVLLADGVLLLVGFAAFEYQYYQVRRNARMGGFVHRLNQNFRAMDATIIISGAVVCFVVAAIVGRSAPSPPLELFGASVVVAVAAGHLLREAHQWRTIQQRLQSVM